MRRLRFAAAALTAAGALVAGGTVFADMSGLVGDTVVGSTPDKLTRRVQLHADGSYRISVSDGSPSTGAGRRKARSFAT